jgi:hypothetical protein
MVIYVNFLKTVVVTDMIEVSVTVNDDHIEIGQFRHNFGDISDTHPRVKECNSFIAKDQEGYDILLMAGLLNGANSIR